MGKPKKANVKNKKLPLGQQINKGKVLKSKNRDKIRLHDEEDEEELLDSKTSQKVLLLAKKQHLEINQSDDQRERLKRKPKSKVHFGEVESDEDDDDVDDQHVTDQDFYDDIQIDEEDEKAFELFQNAEGKKTKNLSEIILEKIAEKQSDIQTKFSDAGSLNMEELDPRVKEMYEGVRDVMKRYRSGKIPKAFKVIPKLKNWEQILFITEPHNWTAASMFQATRSFSSVLSQHMAQRFYNLVLLPRIRDDLSEYKRLNVHLYTALRKALFKPAAFMKGIILPLLESGDCTLREAIIFGSVIAKNRVPVLHSSACLLKICEMGYSGANSIFIRIFLDKRYALPYRVIDAAVFHFLRFEHDKRKLPVLWHQSLLTFVQRYKNDISSEQKEALLGLLRKQSHPKITPDIRRELQAAKCRDVEMMEPDPSEMENYNMMQLNEDYQEMETYVE